MTPEPGLVEEALSARLELRPMWAMEIILLAGIKAVQAAQFRPLGEKRQRGIAIPYPTFDDEADPPGIHVVEILAAARRMQWGWLTPESPVLGDASQAPFKQPAIRVTVHGVGENG